MTQLIIGFEKVEQSLTDALAGLTNYYTINHLRANPEKTQISVFHLKNRDATRKLNVCLDGRRLLTTPGQNTLELPWTIPSATKIMPLRQRWRYELETTTWGSCPTLNGEQAQWPFKALHLLCAIRRLNMPVLFGAVPRMLRRWIQSSTRPAELFLVALNQRMWTTYICYVVLLHLRSEE